MINSIMALYLSITSPTGRNITLSILIGHDCPLPITMTPDWQECKTKNIAELKIDDKIVGFIPIGDLSEAELQNLMSAVQSINKEKR